MQLYDSSGYVNIQALMDHPATFIFCYGGRGTGKTYGTLQWAVDHEIGFMYTRRLKSQAEVAAGDDMQPFNAINMDRGWSVVPFKANQYTWTFADSELDDKGILRQGKRHGVMSALSTFKSIRGLSAEWIDLFIHDEFIPDENERPIKGEAKALFNAYESLNRNRELQGRPPMKLICLANANDIANPVFMELGLVRIAEKMRREGRDWYYMPKQRMLLVDLFRSEISEQKSRTALYDLTRGTEFYNMAVKNSFMGIEKGRIAHQNVREYRPIVKAGEITIYRHKSRHEYYVTVLSSGRPPVYGAGEKDKERFRKKYSYIWREYMQRRVVFEEYLDEILFCRMFKR